MSNLGVGLQSPPVWVKLIVRYPPIVKGDPPSLAFREVLATITLCYYVIVDVITFNVHVLSS